MAQYICHIGTIAVIESNSYHYRMTPNSLVQGNAFQNCNRDIAVFHAAVCELRNKKSEEELAIYSKVCRLFMNAAIGGWASTGFSDNVNLRVFHEARKNFRFSYIKRSNLPLKEKIIEFALHFPFLWTRTALKLSYNIRGALKGRLVL